MTLQNCVTGSSKCFCDKSRDQRLSTAPIENEVFEDVWKGLFAELNDGSDGHSSHFHILDSFRGRGSSLGFRCGGYDDCAPSADSEVQHFIENAVQKLADGRSLDILKVIEHLAPFDMPRLLRWAWHQFRSRGQALSIVPSRFEQCLAIAARLDRDPNFRAIDDVYISTGTGGYFKIEKYLQPAPSLAAVYAAAGSDPQPASAHAADAGLAPISVDTAAFLVAECVQLWNGHENLGGFIARLREHPPGIALMPVKILDQYRAAATWYFTGSLEDQHNDKLRAHIESVSRDADRWLQPIFDRSMLVAVTFRLLQVVSEYAELGKTPLIQQCFSAQQAFCDLWAAKRVRFLKNDQQIAVWDQSDSFYFYRGGCSIVRLNVATRQSPTAAALGFDQIEYHIPLKLNGSAFNETETAFNELAERRTRQALGFVESAAKRQLELLAQRERENREKVIGTHAHELSHTAREIRSLSAPQPIDPNGDIFARLQSLQSRLNAIDEKASHLESKATVLRELSRRSETSAVFPKFRGGDPSEADLEFWKSYLWCEFRQAALTCRFEHPSHKSSTFRLRMIFEVSDFKKRSRKQTETQVEICQSAQTQFERKDIVGLSQAPWPLLLGHDRAGPGLSALFANLLMGPKELVRNACRVTTQILANRGGVAEVRIRAVFAKANGRWTFQVESTNELASVGAAPDVSKIGSFERIRSTFPQVRFSQSSRERGVASYLCTIDLHT